MKKRRFTEEQIVQMLRTTVSNGGAESDGRIFVFGNYIDEVLVMKAAGGADFSCGHDSLDGSAAMFYASGGE